jgi:GTP-sensing pleiotropic transcriptional regulator CodY
MKIPPEVRAYFNDNCSAWREHFRSPETYSLATSTIKDLPPEAAEDLLGTAISYVSATSNEIAIYQEALAKLHQMQDHEVDEWLAKVGFSVQHNKLGTKLVQKISQLFQNIMQVISNFIKSIVGVLNMKLDEVEFEFSASPSVSLTFK